MTERMTSGDPLIERAAAVLTRIEREILTLSAVEGLDNAVIAALLGFSERRVERLLARALVKFDKAMHSTSKFRGPIW